MESAINYPDNKKKNRVYIQASNIFYSRFTAWVVLLFSLVFTTFAYFQSINSVEKRSLDRFEYRAEKITTDIKERMRIYEQTLRGGVGLFNSTDPVTRKMFHDYVKTLEVNTYWPGIQGIGFAVPILPEEKIQHEQQVRAEGFPDYKIKPEGARDSYSSIIYLEPFDWRNKRAFGYDMWSNPMRQEAMSRAMNEGEAATSGVITLVQETDEDIQKGFLTYLPVYKSKRIPDSIQERQSNFRGWVYCAFRVRDLMEGIIGADDPEIEFEIYDGNEISEKSLLYDSNENIHIDEVSHRPAYSKTALLTLQGRPWTVYLNTPKDYLSRFKRLEPNMIALGGIFLDLLLFYVIWSFHFLQKRAAVIAKEMTQDLEKTKRSLEAKVKTRTIELEKSRSDLEKRVDERTAELEERMAELQVMNSAMVDRELNAESIRKENIKLKAEIEKIKQSDNTE